MTQQTTQQKPPLDLKTRFADGYKGRHDVTSPVNFPEPRHYHDTNNVSNLVALVIVSFAAGLVSAYIIGVGVLR